MRASFGLGLVVVAVASTAFAHKPTVTTFTYNHDIFPIFEAKCGSCHRSGGVAPMSLLTYKEAFPWGVSIKNEVLDLAMPPWFADERYGEFKHGAGLSAKEMDTIVDWCLGGSPEGETPVGTSPSSYVNWPLGEPELILMMPSPMVLDAATSETIQELTFETGLAEPVYLRALDFQPGAPNIVRSATITIRFGGRKQTIATWIPGQTPEALPEGRGRLIPVEAEVGLELHYKKTWLDEGSSVEDRSAVAIYLHDEDPGQLVETVEVTSTSAHTLEADAELVALLPRVDGDIEAVVAEVVRPDGSRERLLRLYHPNSEWPRKYWLVKPIALPAGSRVEVTATAPEGATPVVLVDLIS